jgi:hypothetical protein
MMTAIALPESAFLPVQGSPKTYTYRGDSGLPVERLFCADCGPPIYGKPALAPGMIFLQAPSLDDAAWVRPSLHAYMASAQAWDPTNDQLPRFDKLPPPGAAGP